MKALLATFQRIPHIGGVSTHVEMLARGLQASDRFHGLVCAQNARLGARTRVVCFIRSGFSIDANRANRLKRTQEALARRIGERLGGAGPLVVHCHDALSTCAALDVRTTGIRVIQTVHGPWSRELLMSGYSLESAYYQQAVLMERRAFGEADLLLPVDQGQAIILESDFGVQGPRSRVISNAVDVQNVRKIAANSSDLVPGIPYFIVPRRLVPKNGVELAVRGFARLGATDAVLMIAGDGPLRPSLERIAAELGISNRVKFLGDVMPNELLPLMKGALAVIVPSVPCNGVVEATSLAVLEAMAVGAPVIGSEIGGIAEILQSRENGLLVESGNPAAMGEAMKEVLRMPASERAALTAAATRRVENHYGVLPWLREVFQAYDSLEPLAAPASR